MRGEQRFALKPEVVEQALAGNEEAWVEVYSLTKPFILGLCHSKFNLTVEESQDVCQNVILQLYRTLDRIENLGAWICGAVRRQAGGMRAKEYQEATGGAVDVAVDVADCLSFWHAYSCLSATCRGIFHYVVFAGYSHREAAQRVGIPPGTMHHLKQKCQETFLYHFNGGAHAG